MFQYILWQKIVFTALIHNPKPQPHLLFLCFLFTFDCFCCFTEFRCLLLGLCSWHESFLFLVKILSEGNIPKKSARQLKILGCFSFLTFSIMPIKKAKITLTWNFFMSKNLKSLKNKISLKIFISVQWKFVLNWKVNWKTQTETKSNEIFWVAWYIYFIVAIGKYYYSEGDFPY